MKRFIATLLTVALALNASPQEKYGTEEAWADAQIARLKEKSPTAQERSQWFREARLGMFIHWNQSSVVAAEISWSKQFYDDDGEKLLHNPRPTLKHCKAQEHTDWISWFKPAVPKEIYDHLHKSFYPAMYNADSIVHTAMQAGVKYIVMVTKHHDGFCMWDSEYTDYDIMSTPFARDIVGEMADACHRYGMKFCIYYSQRDWHHPDYSSENLPRYNLYMRNQIKELLTKYAPVAGIFFDAHAWNKDPEVWESETLFKEIYAIAPDILINNRCGVPGDYYTPEQRVGSIDMETMWESCMTFTGEWSWRGFANEVIPVEKCFDYLINCAGGNGNLLLNIDPLPTGQIDPREKSRLKIMGEWLARNGEAIYGTQGGFLRPADWGVSTRKGKNLYLLVKDWNSFPASLPVTGLKIKEITVGDKAIDFKAGKNGVELSVPESCRDRYVTVIKITTNRDLTDRELL